VYNILKEYCTGRLTHAPDEINSIKKIAAHEILQKNSSSCEFASNERIQKIVDDESDVENENLKFKLSAIKTKYDPFNIFKNNANILPLKKNSSNVDLELQLSNPNYI
jgi:hypothetical protein